MKYFYKTIYLIFFTIFVLFFSTPIFAKDIEFKYSKDNISNYFSGIVALDQDYTTTGFKYLNKARSISDKHANFNTQFIRSLVLLEKFDKAFTFSKNSWVEKELFFEADLLLGLHYFIKKDYLNAEKYFERLNNISENNLFFNNFFGNVLISWIKASENNQKESFKFFDKIPKRYNNLKKIQNSFLQCYFDTPKTEIAFEQLIGEGERSFSRYNFFLANYFAHKNKNKAAEIIISNSRNLYNSNLLIKQTEDFILKDKKNKIKNFFNCKNPKDSIAEIFYVIANMYSTQEDFQTSNFYLKISLFLNSKFIPNKMLLAENYFNQKKYELSKQTYLSLKPIGSIYSWYASVNVAMILSDIVDTKKAVENLKKEFNLLSDPNFEHYYEMANFFKENEYYEESIKYYSLALKNIEQDHFLIHKILDRRGTSYERIGKWDKAEQDLLESLKILPEQPHVLNYLAYSWIEKRINIDKSIKMLKKANELKKNDGYIIDSLGWAHYVNQNYIDAEKFLQEAVKIFPSDPIINDHYGDTLWMLNRNLQARYFWKYVLSLDRTEPELKESISKKLIYGIEQKL